MNFFKETILKIFNRFNKKLLITSLILAAVAVAIPITDTLVSTRFEYSVKLLDTDGRDYMVSGTYKLHEGSNEITSYSFFVENYYKNAPIFQICKSVKTPAQSTVYIYEISIRNRFNKVYLNPDVIMQYYNNNSDYTLTNEGNRVKVTFKTEYVYLTNTEELRLNPSRKFYLKMAIILMLLYIVFVILFYFIGYSLKNKKKYSRKTKNILSVAGIFVIPLFIELVLLPVQYQSYGASFGWIREKFDLFLSVYIVLLMLYGAVALLVNHTAATIAVSAPAFLLYVANIYMLKFRGEPIFPWDLSLFGTFVTIAGRVRFFIPYYLIYQIPLLVFVFYLAAAIPQTQIFKRKTLCFSINIIIFASLLFGVCNYIDIKYITNEKNAPMTFTQNRYYELQGIIPAFFGNVGHNKAEKPENYNKAALESAYKEYQTEKEYSNETPDIIMIMSEGFWDVSKIPGISFKEKLLPTLDSIEKSGIYGEMLSSKFGGGTAYVEFSALTGFSTDFMSVAVPYYNICSKPVFSAAGYFKNKGYKTVAMHPYNGTNYNRNIAYGNMGFEKYITEQDFENPLRERGYISDLAVTDRIIEETEKAGDSPIFMFTVTMQNHAGYYKGAYTENELVGFSSVYSDSTNDQIADFATGLNHSDMALGNLINYLKTSNRKTIVIFFGDHTNLISDNGIDIFDSSGFVGDERFYVSHATNLAAWSNYKDVNMNIGTISANMILPKILDCYDIDMPGWFKLLNAANTESKGYATQYIINNDNTISTSLSAKQTKDYNSIKLFQYDYLYGKGYFKNQLFN